MIKRNMEATEKQKNYLKSLIKWYKLPIYPKNNISKEECSKLIDEALQRIEAIKAYRRQKPKYKELW